MTKSIYLTNTIFFGLRLLRSTAWCEFQIQKYDTKKENDRRLLIQIDLSIHVIFNVLIVCSITLQS